MLDYEKVKWMIQRKKRLHYTDPRFQDDSNDICNALTRDMSETMAFLESCTDEEINLLSDELFDVIDAFYEADQGGGGQFVSFLKMLADSRPNMEIEDEIQGIVETLDELANNLPVNKEDFLTSAEAKKQFGLKVDLP
ncbi:hypothetical protein M5X02_01755 [Paenibacillus alvei]|uniref:hypothetical protein n=1 Tax=Paenibacillus alvei TaxID=44250 RepID=UPI000288DECD|nr:hypothetical protein [Paenibacillus alvei]EJW14360.1 hypothetical protein PAV_14c00530 [Paenibacillus alvei DSM 29]EJW14380.1 hypothetical protein PAV_14c00730 [Paenibacillus alvei DSM 29]MCY9539404.1 hypothetical protein [Paenibacillus alvei]MEC0079818.1 hypothetical protein [Paenibacillus alvei]